MASQYVLFVQPRTKLFTVPKRRHKIQMTNGR